MTAYKPSRIIVEWDVSYLSLIEAEQWWRELDARSKPGIVYSLTVVPV